MNKPRSACVCPTVLAQLAVAFCAVVMSAIDPVEAAKSNIDPRRSLVVTEQPILARFFRFNGFSTNWSRKAEFRG